MTSENRRIGYIAVDKHLQDGHYEYAVGTSYGRPCQIRSFWKIHDEEENLKSHLRKCCELVNCEDCTDSERSTKLCNKWKPYIDKFKKDEPYFCAPDIIRVQLRGNLDRFIEVEYGENFIAEDGLICTNELKVLRVIAGDELKKLCNGTRRIYKHGVLRCQVDVKNNESHGEGLTYDENGVLEMKIVFENGVEKVKEEYKYDDSGNLVEKVITEYADKQGGYNKTKKMKLKNGEWIQNGFRMTLNNDEIMSSLYKIMENLTEKCRKSSGKISGKTQEVEEVVSL